MENQYFVYILTNNHNTTLYIGVTNNLIRRAFEHREKLNSGFTKKYNLSKLVYYEVFSDIEQAILKEKRLKGGSRQRKVDLISEFNPNWDDLYEKIVKT